MLVGPVRWDCNHYSMEGPMDLRNVTFIKDPRTMVIARVPSEDSPFELSEDVSASTLIYGGHAKTAFARQIAKLRKITEEGNPNADPKGPLKSFNAVDKWDIVWGVRVAAWDDDDPSYLGIFAGRFWFGGKL